MKQIKFIIYLSILFLFSSCESKQKHHEIDVTNVVDENKLIDKIVELVNSGKWEGVIEYEKIILEYSKDHPKSQLILSLTRAYMEMEQYEKAISTAKIAVKINKDDYMALFYIGVCYDMLEHYDKAETYYLKTLKLRPNYARVNLNLASIYEKTNRNEDAVQQYLKAIELFHEHKLYKEVLECIFRSIPTHNSIVI